MQTEEKLLPQPTINKISMQFPICAQKSQNIMCPQFRARLVQA